MKKIHSGRLRAIGYDAPTQVLCVELDDGERLEYERFTPEMWRRFSASSAPWSYYCDHIRDELTPRRTFRAPAATPARRNPLDDLF